jgi:hypothetical protein
MDADMDSGAPFGAQSSYLRSSLLIRVHLRVPFFSVLLTSKIFPARGDFHQNTDVAADSIAQISEPQRREDAKRPSAPDLRVFAPLR